MVNGMDKDRKTALMDIEGIRNRTRAPENCFRLVEVDYFDAPFCSDTSLGVFYTIDLAVEKGFEIEKKTREGGHSEEFLKYYIYDDHARWVGEIKNGQFSTKK